MKSMKMPFQALLESIIETYSNTNDDVIIESDDLTNPPLEYLERNYFIITTEFPDPAFEDEDLILVRPRGCFRMPINTCFYCFDAENHA